MKIMKKYFRFTVLAVAAISLVIISLSLMSCSRTELPLTTDKKIAQQQDKLMKEAVAQVGNPAIINFQEKRVAKMIYELRDRADLVCYAYIVNQMTGKLVFIGKCVGYGLPYSTQYSNPIKTVEKNYGEFRSISVEQLPQSEPNGLFMPEGLSATWLLMINPETNEPTPVYIEPEILVSPFKMH